MKGEKFSSVNEMTSLMISRSAADKRNHKSNVNVCVLPGLSGGSALHFGALSSGKLTSSLAHFYN